MHSRDLIVSTKSIALGMGLLALTAGSAAAEESGSASSAVSSSSLSAAAAADLGVAAGPNPEHGVPVAGWMLYPSFMGGVVFNDNLYQLRTQRIAGVGIRLRPTLSGSLDNGLHKSSLYFMADAQIYPGQSGVTRFIPTPVNYVAPTNVSGRAGFSHLWSPMEDLNFGFVADYTRQNGLFGSNFGSSLNGPNILSTGVVSNTPQYTNQVSAYISAEKKITDRWFLRGATGAQYVAYDSQPSEPYWSTALYGANYFRPLNGVAYTASLRSGFWLTPQIYGFVEPVADLRFYQNSWSDTNGYRIIGGIGSDMISLFRGEIYGGYQQQMSAHGYFNSVSAPAFGARIFYYPTRYLTVTASVDQTLSSGANQPTNAFGLPLQAALPGGLAAASSQTLIARIQADYALSQYWTAYIRGGYGVSHFYNPSNTQTQWTAGLGVNYNFWRNISATLEYQFARTASTFSNNWWALTGGDPLTAAFWNGTPSGYTQNLLSAGLTYRY